MQRETMIDCCALDSEAHLSAKKITFCSTLKIDMEKTEKGRKRNVENMGYV